MFFDNASTTMVDETIIDKLKKFNKDYFYNPGALYKTGQKSKVVLETMRNELLEILDGDGKIIFTGSATEANNLALIGSVKKNTKKILVSVGEHPSVYNTALELKARGFDVEFVNLDKSGKVDIVDFENKMTADVDLVSIMHVNNETGAINDIATLVEIAKSKNKNVIFHSDGVQAFGKIPVSVSDLGVDMYTISAHKIHGSKGVGALFLKNKVGIKPIIFGGGQEGGLRSGTENMLGIFTLVEAGKIATNNLEENYQKVSDLKKYFIKKLSDSNVQFLLNSSEDNSPYVVSISLLNCRAETILNMLSDNDIFVGNGSACSSKKRGNRILENMGLSQKEIDGNLRISFSKYNTETEVDFLVEKLVECVYEYIKNTKLLLIF